MLSWGLQPVQQPHCRVLDLCGSSAEDVLEEIVGEIYDPDEEKDKLERACAHPVQRCHRSYWRRQPS